MKNAPLISVITVCYNSATSLERTISSVADQDFQNVEHIIIDGGSYDGTIEILNRHSAQLAHIVSEPDDGIYDAMNKGLRRANGDIICFLNADDFFASESVLSRVAEQMDYLDLDALIADVGYFYSSNPEKLVRRYRSDRFSPKLLAWGWMPAHPGLFLRKLVIDRVGYFKDDYEIAGDYEYVVRAFYNQNLKYKHLSEIVVNMQLGGASTSGWRAKLQLNREVVRACRENGIKTNLLKVLSKYPMKFLETVFK